MFTCQFPPYSRAEMAERHSRGILKEHVDCKFKFRFSIQGIFTCYAAKGIMMYRHTVESPRAFAFPPQAQSQQRKNEVLPTPRSSSFKCQTPQTSCCNSNCSCYLKMTLGFQIPERGYLVLGEARLIFLRDVRDLILITMIIAYL